MSDQPMPSPSLIEIIRTLSNSNEADISFVVAGTINLYLETLRRVHGRVILEPADIANIFSTVDTMIGAYATKGYEHVGRERKPNEEEQKIILNGGQVKIESDRRR